MRILVEAAPLQLKVSTTGSCKHGWTWNGRMSPSCKYWCLEELSPAQIFLSFSVQNYKLNPCKEQLSSFNIEETPLKPRNSGSQCGLSTRKINNSILLHKELMDVVFNPVRMWGMSSLVCTARGGAGRALRWSRRALVLELEVGSRNVFLV